MSKATKEHRGKFMQKTRDV